MKVYMLWEQTEPNDGPYLIDAIDEYTIDAWGGWPDFFVAKQNVHTRVLAVEVSDETVRNLFEIPVVTA